MLQSIFHKMSSTKLPTHRKSAGAKAANNGVREEDKATDSTMVRKEARATDNVVVRKEVRATDNVVVRKKVKVTESVVETAGSKEEANRIAARERVDVELPNFSLTSPAYMAGGLPCTTHK